MAGQDKGRPTLGLLFKRGNGASPETFTAIAEVKDINGPNLKLSTQDSTHLQDTWKGIKPILLEGGEIKLVLNFLVDDASQSLAAGLLLDFATKALRNFQILWPDGAGGVVATWPLAAYVTGFTPKGSVTTITTADVVLSIDGTPAFI
jgi:hypothetical protein